MSMVPMTACEWRLGPLTGDEIRIVERAQRDGTVLYSVLRSGWVLTKAKEWEYEPIPSSRDEAFIARTRWDDWEDAARAAQRIARDSRPWDRRRI